MTITRGNRFEQASTNKGVREKAQALIDGLKDVSRGPRTLRRSTPVRIDMQGITTGGFRNIQIQLNVPRSSSLDSTTIAGVLLQAGYDGTAAAAEVRIALARSLSDGHMYVIKQP